MQMNSCLTIEHINLPPKDWDEEHDIDHKKKEAWALHSHIFWKANQKDNCGYLLLNLYF